MKTPDRPHAAPFSERAHAVEIDWGRAAIRKVSVCLGGHATSFSLEESFLTVLKSMASSRNMAFARLVWHIDESRPAHISLSSALRLAVLHDLCRTASLQPPVP